MWYPWAAPAPVMPIWCPAPPQNGPVIIIIEPEEEKVAPPPPPAPKPPPPPVSCLSLLICDYFKYRTQQTHILCLFSTTHSITLHSRQ